MSVVSRRGFQTDEKIVENSLKTFTAKLAAYEVILSKQKYLAGDVRDTTLTFVIDV